MSACLGRNTVTGWFSKVEEAAYALQTIELRFADSTRKVILFCWAAPPRFVNTPKIKVLMTAGKTWMACISMLRHPPVDKPRKM